MIELYKVCHGMACLLKNKATASWVCNKIGLLYVRIQRLNRAIYYLNKHISMCKETGDLASEESSYGNIGNVYHSLGQYEKAIEYFKKALTICRETGDLAGERRRYGNIGKVCDSLGQYEKALEYHEKCLSICRGKVT